MCVCVCVCVCVRVPSSLVSDLFYSVCVCVCVSVRACTCTLCELKTLRKVMQVEQSCMSIANKKKFSKGCAQ